MTEDKTRRRFSLRRLFAWCWLPVLLLAAFWVRMPALDKPLWEDEATALRSASRAVRLVPAEAFSPRKWTDRLAYGLMETGELATVRLPYVGWGLLGIALGWVLGRQLRDRWLGAALALILAFWPWRVYWDGLIRDYAAMAAWGMILWVGAERFRRRGSPGAFALLLALTIPAVLVHELSVLLLPVPAIYLMWHGMRGGARWLSGRVRGARAGGTDGDDPANANEAAAASTPPVARHVLRFGAMTLLLGVVLAAGLHWAVGPEVLGKILEHGRAGAEVVSETAQSAAGPAVAGTGGQPAARLPGPGQAMQFAADNVSGAFGPQPSAGTLLGFRVPGPHHEPRGLYNQIVMDLRGWFPVPPRLDLILLAGLVMGTLGLALRSPPLVASLWAVIWGTALIVDLNTHVRVPMDRYYTLAAGAGAILLAAGIAVPLRALRWGMFHCVPGRLRWRWNACVVLAGMAAGLMAMGWWAVPAAREAAAYHNEDWRAFWERTLAENPNGAFLTGERSVHFEAYKRLYLHSTDPALSRAAERSRINDTDGWTLKGDAAIFDHLNGMDALVIFQPGYRRRQPYMPLDNPDTYFSFDRYDEHNLIARTASLAGRGFVTRGRTELDLAPHFMGSTSAAGIDLWFETPGFYAVGFSDAGLVDFTGDSRVAMHGEPVAFETVGTTHPLARKLFGESGNGAALRAVQIVKIAPAQRARVSSVIGAGLVEPFGSMPIVFIEDEWTSTPAGLSAGRIQQWLGADGLPRFGFAVRIETGDTRLMYAEIQLREQGAAQPAAAWRMQINDPMRRLRAGDVLWSGDLAVGRGAMPGIVGKALSLSITPVALDVPIDDARLSKRLGTPAAEMERLIKPPETTRIAFLRYRPTPEGIQIDVGR